MALSVSHLLNDTIQSLIAAVYPVLKGFHALTFTQIGLITLAFQFTSSLLQPLVGLYTDRRPLPFSLAVGMGVTLGGLLLLSAAGNFHAILIAAALVGIGSAVFHPEASRVARLASGAAPNKLKFDGYVDFTLELRDATGAVTASDGVKMKVAPWVMLSNQEASVEVCGDHWVQSA